MTEVVEPTKRMTASRMLEALLAKGSGDRSSITIARNAKGDVQFEVVVRTGDNASATTVLEAETQAGEIFDRLTERYPRTEPDPHAEERATVRKLNEQRRKLQEGAEAT